MRILIFSFFFLVPLLPILQNGNKVSAFGQCVDGQKQLLLNLKQELDFNSTFSTKLVSWNDSFDCCNWDGVSCDELGHVIRLDLQNETISGGIDNSSSLFGFHYLESLNLACNIFYPAQIPSGFYRLANLVYLNLSEAGFVGQVPVDFAKMRTLVTLDLSTRFPGFQPLQLENPNLKSLVQNLTKLKFLYLDGVNISAAGNEWCGALSSLSDLQELSLCGCQLSGPITSALSELRSLSVIRLDNNNLSTTVPDFFAQLSNLTQLRLGSCNLQGPFPEKIFQVPTMQILDLSANKLSGNLPQFPPSGSFSTIVLSHTNFSGSLPDSIGNLQNLSTIDLSNCNFRGPIPSSMANLEGLVYLDFSWNEFSGPIPVFQKSQKMNYIDLSRNNLSGPISSLHFEGLHQLLHLNLGSNSFNGSIPPSVFSLPKLQKLILANNQFSGPVIENISVSISFLDTLDLSSNQLTGLIPESFFQHQKLNVLTLSSNRFSGTVQLEAIKSLPNLTRLELSSNNLSIDASLHDSTRPFPQLTVLKLASCNLQEFPDLRNMSKMMHLDLSDNNITGEVPNWVWTVGLGTLTYLNLSCNFLSDLEKPYSISDNLAVIDLHSNHLQGEIPTPPLSAIYVDYSNNNFDALISPDIGKSIAVAYFFSLSDNNLKGIIPETICNGSYLKVLDLSNNFLSGSIPECIFENLEALGVLNLGSNNLSGRILDTFPPYCSLKTLDLSRNILVGKVPRSLVNCASLEVLNIGGNKIEDAFPCMLKNLSSLRVLVLRDNLFGGEVHCHGPNVSWPNLQIVDIASNNFNGDLSTIKFANWKAMMVDDGNGKSTQNHLSFEFLTLSRLYYQDTIMVTIKGLEMELQKILTVYTSIDFSSNKFEGRIPEAVGNLKALYVLNLSYNSLTGTIPKTIGNLTLLESLDLSRNQLEGMIPVELTDLTFLSFLNLSFNKLFGKIPTGRQFQTFSNTSYLGNTGLCSFPLDTNCNNNAPEYNYTHDGVKTKFDWQFIFIGLGFGVGAAVILAPLMAFKEGRDLCDGQLEKLLRLIFPAYRFTYTRYDEGKYEAADNFEADFEDDLEDFDQEEYGKGEEKWRGRYCVFCTKLDKYRKKAIHNLECNCHISPSLSDSLTSSSSLLILHHTY